MKITVNQKPIDIPDDWQDEPLLWVLRELAGLTGTKLGCGVGTCGACSVLVDGQVTRSCVMPVSAMPGRSITTIEGLATEQQLHPVQQAWLDERVPQCGYCQAGQIISAVALLQKTPHPDEQQIDAAMAGQLCRCGTQTRIRKAVKRAAGAAS